MVVEAADIEFTASIQCTTAPFKSMLTESIDNVEIRGEAPRAEFLMKVIVVELIILCVCCSVVYLELLKAVISSSIPCSLISVRLHSKNSIDAVHIS